MTPLTITLFGPPQITLSDHSVVITRRKGLALLAYLARDGRSHSRDALATLLWPEASQSKARAGLRSALWALNKTPLTDWLEINAETITFQRNPQVDIDVIQFETLLARAEEHAHTHNLCPECVVALSRAVDLYQADFMAGFNLPDAPTYDEWQFFQADSLRRALGNALQRLINHHSQQTNYEVAITHARQLVNLDPLHEPAHQTLMRLYAHAGQTAAALRQLQICRETLAAELGVEPSTATARLAAQIRAGELDPKTAAAEAPPAAPQPHNIPTDPTPFIGRENEREQLLTFLTDSHPRLITIVGPGGIGKTRLALVAAQDALTQSDFQDGVFVVLLAPLSEPEEMLSLIAETVGYPLQGDQRRPEVQLIDFLRHKQMLLLLDNFEHLLTGAQFVADLLREAPGIRLLVTSRERLNLLEEQLLPLEGLALAGDDAEESPTESAAARLFLQSVRRKRPFFHIDPADRPHLAEICRLVDGMPLGLELAAAWTEMLPLQALAAEIQSNLDFLESDRRNIPDRHRSLRAVFESSWERLSPEEQSVYAQLSFFRDGFTLAAARAVTGATLSLLTRLVNRSLLRPSQLPGRFAIHELLRQYAALKLAEDQALDFGVRARHAAYFCDFLAARSAALLGARQQKVLHEIEAELENILVAWRWAAAQREVALLDAALFPLALVHQWHGRIHSGVALWRLALKQLSPGASSASDHLRARLLIWQAVFEIRALKLPEAAEALQQAEELLDGGTLKTVDTRAERAQLLLERSMIKNRESFGGEGLALNERGLALFRELDNSWGINLALDFMGGKLQELGDIRRAIEVQEESLAISEKMAGPRAIAQAYSRLGHYILFAGDLARSERYLQTSLERFRELGMRADQRLPLLILGINYMFAGQFAASKAHSEACWAIHRELGMPHEPGAASVGITRALFNMGEYATARRVAEDNLQRYTQLNLKWYIAFSQSNLGRIELVEGNAARASELFEASVAQLLEISDRPLVTEVLQCSAIAERQLGRPDEARQLVAQALTLALEALPLNPLRFELPAMALLALDDGDVERAVELYAAAKQSGYIANSRWFEEVVGREIAAAASRLPAERLATAQARGRARDLTATARELLAELSG